MGHMTGNGFVLRGSGIFTDSIPRSCFWNVGDVLKGLHFSEVTIRQWGYAIPPWVNTVSTRQWAIAFIGGHQLLLTSIKELCSFKWSYILTAGMMTYHFYILLPLSWISIPHLICYISRSLRGLWLGCTTWPSAPLNLWPISKRVWQGLTFSNN